jgi:hypothetical protein
MYSVSPEAVHYVARAAAFEVSVAMRAMTPEAQKAREAELEAIWHSIPQHDRPLCIRHRPRRAVALF